MDYRDLLHIVLLVVYTSAPLSIAVTDECGISGFSSRIVGGADASERSWPWQISLQYQRSHICGGSLISTRSVLTAAHCFAAPIDPSDYTVVLGAYQLSVPNSNAVTSQVQSIVVNSQYTGTGSSGDIALITLSSAVTYTEYIRPVCLPSSSSDFQNGMDCWTTGWGDIYYDVSLPSPKTLQQVMLPLISRDDCNAMYNIGSQSGTTNSVQSDQICAGYAAGGKDSCQGDSGGPLVCQVGSVWYQVGIVSNGEKCALPNRPGIYTLVSYYNSWIMNSCSMPVPPVSTLLLLIGALTLLLN